MVMGTFLLNNHYVSMLFDTGVSKSFVSITFRPLIALESDKLIEAYTIELADGNLVRAIG